MGSEDDVVRECKVCFAQFIISNGNGTYNTSVRRYIDFRILKAAYTQYSRN